MRDTFVHAIVEPDILRQVLGQHLGKKHQPALKPVINGFRKPDIASVVQRNLDSPYPHGFFVGYRREYQYIYNLTDRYIGHERGVPCPLKTVDTEFCRVKWTISDLDWEAWVRAQLDPLLDASHAAIVLLKKTRARKKSSPDTDKGKRKARAESSSGESDEN